MSLPACRSTRVAKAATAIAAALVMLPALPLAGQTAAEWTHWGADASSTRYSPLDQIDASNFNNLDGSVSECECARRQTICDTESEGFQISVRT